MSAPTPTPPPGDPDKVPDELALAAAERLKRARGELPPPPPDLPADDAAFAARLKAAREERNFTQAAVANRSRMIDPAQKGVSRTAIIAYEQGTTKPGIRELRMLCEVLHVTPNWLIYGTDSAAKAALPSLEFFNGGRPADLRDVLTLSLAILSLKGHERDSLLTLALSLAGRELGDVRLSSLMSWGWLLQDQFLNAIKSSFPDEVKDLTLEQLAAHMADEGTTTNMGNRFRLGEEGEILNPETAVYPGPTVGKSRKS
ncbi:helix-turn-helix domain-containing protein [Ramlibacter humi]|uniref:XRE family transcriptional regulator n=1 Tax=Ramlibacter humi TaxID=2530451 RepID=A0A4Z0BUN0_9BURK|nr:helix-turn-helix transcriptional regulator [Ramlibacter humi]TFZ02100.1 XRE family transcriptional regulator [Ramlibacter humi]